ncbi:unnamed protein product [Rhizophagus irregularis]|nr:unnamed protein product [Rhizophagus irregularis]
MINNSQNYAENSEYDEINNYLSTPCDINADPWIENKLGINITNEDDKETSSNSSDSDYCDSTSIISSEDSDNDDSNSEDSDSESES